jgi:hypothetical protein
MHRHHYLHIADDHLDPTEAMEAVVRLAEATGAAPPDAGWHQLALRWQGTDGSEQHWRFDELVEATRQTGVVPELQHRLDRADPVFGAALAEPELLTGAGHSLLLRSSYAGQHKELSVPCRYAAIEFELAADILAHRAAACAHSDADDLVETCRYFRAYLHACVDLLEAFLHRHACWLTDEPEHAEPMRAFPCADDTEARVAWWLAHFAHTSLADIAESHEWGECVRLLRTQRELQHRRGPFLGHSVREIARQLNFVRDGVGGLLHLLRLLAGRGPLGFIEQLRSAPRVTFRLPRQRAAMSR